MSNRVAAAIRCGVVLLLVCFCASVSHAQFSSSVQGTVQDPSGAGVPKVTIVLTNTATKIASTTTSDESGNYRFLSLAPGAYELTAEASGFNKTVVSLTVETDQNLNLPVNLKVKSVAESVEVTSQAPVLNTAETRNQMTIETQALSTLPLAGRSMISLVTLAPGVTGLGTMGGGVPGGGGTPGSGADNYSTETEVDASANGQGTMSNMWVVDGLDVTSGIRQGILNLTPNPDTVQEASIQVNTFSVDYGRASSVQTTYTTKSGTDQFHGLVSDYFFNQTMYAKFSLPGSGASYAPFHSNNISAAVGGPIIPHHQFFFFFSIEPLREATSTGNQALTFTDPAFTTWAEGAYPTNLGTTILKTYVPSNATFGSVAKTANDIFPGTCGTAATNNLPCATPMTDNGIFNSTNYRNGTQWNIRVDKYLHNDRIYGQFFRTVLNYGGAAVIPQFGTTNNTYERALQVNWTHTFSPDTLNEAIFAQNRVEGKNVETGDFSVPPISITGQSVGYGEGFAQGDFIQHNYHWRDVLTHVHGAHTLKFGYDGWFGDDVEPFQGPYSQPNFAFNNLLNLVQDAPHTEGNTMYNPLTGQPVLWEWNAASSNWGLFAEDTWKVRSNLSLTLGLRWDDQGNPYSRNATTAFGNFYFGPGQTFQEQVANGFSKATHYALNHAVTNLLSPRIGFAWDPTGHGVWVLRGGAGIYNNWLTQANVQEEFRGDPPGPVQPVFTAGGSGIQPIFTLGTKGDNTPPFGFTYPTIPAGLNAQGGAVGLAFPIGGINPNLKSPQTYTAAITLERKIGSKYAASVGYSGSHSVDLVSNGNQAGIVSYGVDINEMPGDLIANWVPGSTNAPAPTRLNHSFGAITYSANDRVSNYNSLVFDFHGRLAKAFFDASYTRSRSNDDAGRYPTALDPMQYYGPSPWDVPNRFSLSFNYQIPGMNGGEGLVGRATGGWGISGTSIYQTGYPFTVINTAPFVAVLSNNTGTGVPIGYAAGSGDYNADGDNFDFPNAAGYSEATSRSQELAQVFAANQFTAPATFGAEGSEKSNQFREPNFAETDAAIYKDTRITEKLNFQIRFEFFNLFNRPNFVSIDNNLADGNFGRVNQQQLPRNWQIGGKFTF